MSNPIPYRPQRLVSGGQTGVDRGALDAAMEVGVPHGGWCPRGRIATDGVIPRRYELVESDAASYPTRTRLNVRDSDATLLLYDRSMGQGTKLTLGMCRQMDKPCLVVELGEASVEDVREWLDEHRPQVLNVAGSRGDAGGELQRQVKEFLVDVLGGTIDADSLGESP